jgi:hypothetical protein
MPTKRTRPGSDSGAGTKVTTTTEASVPRWRRVEVDCDPRGMWSLVAWVREPS